MYELPTSDSDRRPASRSLWTDSERSRQVPAVVRERFLLLERYTGLPDSMYPSERMWSRQSDGKLQSSPRARRHTMSQNDAWMSPGESAR